MIAWGGKTPLKTKYFSKKLFENSLVIKSSNLRHLFRFETNNQTFLDNFPMCEVVAFYKDFSNTFDRLHQFGQLRKVSSLRVDDLFDHFNESLWGHFRNR